MGPAPNHAWWSSPDRFVGFCGDLFLLVIHPTSSKIIREHFTEDSAAPLHSGLAGLCLPNAAPELVVHSCETHAYIMALWGTPQGITLKVNDWTPITHLSDTYFSLIT